MDTIELNSETPSLRPLRLPFLDSDDYEGIFPLPEFEDTARPRRYTHAGIERCGFVFINTVLEDGKKPSWKLKWAVLSEEHLLLFPDVKDLNYETCVHLSGAIVKSAMSVVFVNKEPEDVKSVSIENEENTIPQLHLRAPTDEETQRWDRLISAAADLTITPKEPCFFNTLLKSTTIKNLKNKVINIKRHTHSRFNTSTVAVSSPIVKAGYIAKHSGLLAKISGTKINSGKSETSSEGVNTWHAWWFILQENGQLLYTTDSQNPEYTGIVYLPEARVCIVDGHPERQFTISVNSNTQQLLLSFTSHAEMSEWVKLLYQRAVLPIEVGAKTVTPHGYLYFPEHTPICGTISDSGTIFVRPGAKEAGAGQERHYILVGSHLLLFASDIDAEPKACLHLAGATVTKETLTLNAKAEETAAGIRVVNSVNEVEQNMCLYALNDTLTEALFAVLSDQTAGPKDAHTPCPWIQKQKGRSKELATKAKGYGKEVGSGEVKKEGFMAKAGGAFCMEWQMRYFRFREGDNEVPANLAYYYTPEDPTPKDVLYLQEFFIDTTTRTDKANCFVVSGNLRQALSCQNPSDRVQWMEVLLTAIPGSLLEDAQEPIPPSSQDTTEDAGALVAHTLEDGESCEKERAKEEEEEKKEETKDEEKAKEETVGEGEDEGEISDVLEVDISSGSESDAESQGAPKPEEANGPNPFFDDVNEEPPAKIPGTSEGATATPAAATPATDADDPLFEGETTPVVLN